MKWFKKHYLQIKVVVWLYLTIVMVLNLVWLTLNHNLLGKLLFSFLLLFGLIYLTSDIKKYLFSKDEEESK